MVSVTTEKLESTNTEERAIAAWGISVRDLTRAYLRDNRIPPTKGVLVTGARAGSPGANAKIQAYDIILRVNDRAVTTADELVDAIDQWAKKPQAISVDVSRDRGQITLVVKPTE